MKKRKRGKLSRNSKATSVHSPLIKDIHWKREDGELLALYYRDMLPLGGVFYMFALARIKGKWNVNHYPSPEKSLLRQEKYELAAKTGAASQRGKLHRVFSFPRRIEVDAVATIAG